MLVNEFPPLQVGGAERQAERLSANLAKRGWSVWVLTRHAPNLPANESRLGFNIIRPAAWGPGKLQTVTFVLGALFELWRLRRSYSLLHAHLAFGPAFAGVLAAHFLGKRVVVKLGNSGEFGDIRVSQKTWRGKLRLAVLRSWADAIIVLDDAMQVEALANGFSSDKVRRIVNGINTKTFYPTIARKSAKQALSLDEKTVVISIGRLSAQKSLPMLIQAFAVAHLQNQSLHLLILGEGPDRAALEMLVASTQIGDSVTFAGNQSDVRPYLAAADIFVLPSASEGISNALLEAMSAGLACLATPVGGNPQVLDQGSCGLLLPVGDVPAWSRALVDVSLSASLMDGLGKAALKHVRSEYDFDVVGARMESLYADLLNKANIGTRDSAEEPLGAGKS